MHYASGTTFLFGVIFLALIEIRNLCKTFGTGSTAVHALEDVSLDIEAGEIFGIIGLSGAGKSTLVRCMNLLERPTSGTVTVDGADMTALSDKELRAARREIGMIFQSFNLLMQRNALANVRFPLELAGVPKKEANKRAQELLDMVGLGDRAEAFPAQLSGGQKQRVAIARALINNPKVLLLDEPLGALDLKLRKQMQIELKRLQKKLAITFVYVTHDQEEALTMSDRIAVMNGGVIEQLDEPMVIYNHPRTRFVAGFIGESNIFDGTVKAVEGDLLRVETPAGMLTTRGEGFQVGEEMHVSIRPEHLEYGLAPAEGFDLPAVVKDFTYMGTVVKTALDLRDGQEVKFSRFEQDYGLREGEQLFLRWSPEKSVAIKKSAAAQ